MTLPQKKIWICLMGFSLMSQLIQNRAIANEPKESKVTVKECFLAAKDAAD